MLIAIFTLLLGFVVLIVGGELLVRGAVRVAEKAGMSQLLIGLTIVGFGTSAPELVASVEAARAGSPGIAWGNVVGSNLANSLLILGTASLILPMMVPRGPLGRDGGLAFAATIVLWLVATTSGTTVLFGAAFLALLTAYLIYAYWVERTRPVGASALHEKAEALEVTDTHLHDEQPLWRAILVLLAGIVLIVAGGRWLVEGAVDLARLLGMSEAVIGLTVIAIGTSLPELVTSVIAAYKGASAVALGNVLGSNIFNLLLIGGVTAVIAPGSIPPEIAGYGLPLLIVASAVLLIFAITGRRISRWEGAILLTLYIAQLIYNLVAV
ncbi:cation:H+ antiporter [Parasphingorhabdus marina DSM 22363]|uniref:Cation:H+ antiporter n=1 Tax=Parasphingorhabdus marina DSM 22363 TaxID=1123272 RepID=A0A1N6ESL5_9SPHN|nr:calcium/sodium antiporter [Parasphingorhabdus marina]SIN85990.1 cation:H+ antiporter [Parasphingorhabdus marina DSM 22363]